MRRERAPRPVRRPSALPRAHRHPRRPPARVGAVDRAGRGVRRPGRRATASTWSSRRSSSTSRCSSGSGESTDVVRKEMYDFDDKGGRRLALRPEGTASVGAGVRAAPARPCRGRSGTSRRTSATSDRRRAATASTGRSASRCSGVDDPTVDVEVIALAHGFYRDARAARRSRCSSTRWATRETARALLERAARVLARARRRARRRRSASASRRTRCASSTRSDPDWQDMIEHAPQIGEYLTDARRARTSRRCSTGSTALGIALRDRRRGWCAASTTTRAPRSSSRATRSTPRRTRSAAAAATTGSSSRWAASPRRASASGSASSGC